MTAMRKLTLLLALVLTFAAVAHEPVSVTTVILVRHAEKVPDPALKDPALTEAGNERGRELARVLAGTPVHAILTTPFERTRKTAVPLAEAKKVKAKEIQTGKTYATDVAALIRRQYRGKTVVVVGHTNSTQQVIQELGIKDAPAIAESEYDNLFIVTFANGITPKLVALRYGAAAR